MPTPRRAFERTAVVGLALIAATACAREAVVVADGLVAPVGVAVHGLGDRVVVIDRVAPDAGRLHEYRVTDGKVGERREVTSVTPGAARWIGETLLIGGVSVFACPADFDPTAVTRARSPEGNLQLGPPSATDRFAFAVDQTEGRLWRTRRVDQRLTNLRAVDRDDPSVRLSGVAVSPSGYLVTIATTESESGSLQFRDPEQPEAVTASLPIRGLGQSIALAYGATEREQEAPLFALARDGVYRFDAIIDRGDAACQAVRVLEVDQPTAFSIGPGDSIFVTTARGELLFSEADQ